MLDIRIRQHHFRIGTSLSSAVAVAAPSVGQIPVMLVNVQKRVNDIDFTRWIDKSDEGIPRAIGIPDCVEVIIIDRAFSTTSEGSRLLTGINIV